MGPIDYTSQFRDPSTAVFEGFATALNTQGAQQKLAMNDAAEARARELHPLAIAGAELGMDAQTQGMDLAAQGNARANDANARAGQQFATQQAQAAQAQARQQQFQADMAALAEKGPGATAQDYAEVSAKYPEFANSINSSWDGLDEARKAGMSEVMGQVVTALQTENPNTAISLLDQYATASENSGDAAASATARGLMRAINADPNAGLASVGLALQTVNPEMAAQILGGGTDEPAEVRALKQRAAAAGLTEGTPEYQEFMLNGGAAPANFRALEMQADAAGLTKGTPEYARFMATRGAGDQAFARVEGENLADIETGRPAAAEVAAGSAEGKREVEGTAELNEMQRNMGSLQVVVDQLYDLSQTATYTGAGLLRDEARRQLGLPASQGAIDRAEYIAVVDNQVLPLLRQTFGAAFTAKEGETLRNTLGDPNKTPEAKQAVLRAFIAQKERDLIARGGTVPARAPLGETNSQTSSGQRSYLSVLD